MQIRENFSLQQYNTFHIQAIAEKFAAFHTEDELRQLLQIAGNEPHLVLGGGSNILLTGNVKGYVLLNALQGIELVQEDADFYYVKAAAGESWHGFVLHCLQHNYAGVENLSLIPGSVGASPMQNIGAYGVEIKDVFHSLEALHIKEQTIKTFTLDECAFGYRESIFKRAAKGQYIILNVTYRLRKQPVYNTSYGAIAQELEKMQVQQITIQAVSQAVINIRRSKLPDPAEIGNAGSFFKNPLVTLAHYQNLLQEYPFIAAYKAGEEHMKLAAGWLIEQCGWKGYRKGDAGCHAKQALVLVNYGNAAGNEILELSQEIIRSVHEKFGVELEREVNMV
jgi:UDP-N-acetylmuramate dehydrogenase